MLPFISHHQARNELNMQGQCCIYISNPWNKYCRYLAWVGQFRTVHIMVMRNQNETPN